MVASDVTVTGATNPGASNVSVSVPAAISVAMLDDWREAAA